MVEGGSLLLLLNLDLGIGVVVGGVLLPRMTEQCAHTNSFVTLNGDRDLRMQKGQL